MASAESQFLLNMIGLLHSLIGDWDFDYCDFPNGQERHVEGEWIFRRILNGTGVVDLFLCPSRKTITTAPQPDGEYGVAIRMFNSAAKTYDMVYTCEKYMVSLTFSKERDLLVGYSYRAAIREMGFLRHAGE